MVVVIVTVPPDMDAMAPPKAVPEPLAWLLENVESVTDSVPPLITIAPPPCPDAVTVALFPENAAATIVRMPLV